MNGPEKPLVLYRKRAGDMVFWWWQMPKAGSLCATPSSEGQEILGHW
jgi:hypothetical protein